MNRIIYKKFYTYELVDEDMKVYTWKFVEDDGFELIYTNEATGMVTYVEPHQDPVKFEKENDVWLDRASLVAEIASNPDEITFEFDEPLEEGKAWFKSLYGDYKEIKEDD